jgi:hypothetical protein
MRNRKPPKNFYDLKVIRTITTSRDAEEQETLTDAKAHVDWMRQTPTLAT